MFRNTAIRALAAAVFVCTLPQATAQTLPVPGHPLIGAWQWMRADNQCVEEYDFRPDGTVPVTSGSERTDSVYMVSPSPVEGAFYQLTIRIIKDYGGRDCAGDEADNSGQWSTVYLAFDARRLSYFLCAEPRPDRCVGPWRRFR